MKDLPEEFLDWFLITEASLIFREMVFRRACEELVESMRDFLRDQGQEC